LAGKNVPNCLVYVEWDTKLYLDQSVMTTFMDKGLHFVNTVHSRVYHFGI